MADSEAQVAIIGAGISGVSAYCALKKRNISSLVIEKSRGLGGRMSTRRGTNFTADFGAQYTSARNPDWAETVLNLGMPIWIPGESQYPRFVYGLGMSKLVAAGLGETNRSAVAFEHRVVRIVNGGNRWSIECENGAVFKSQAILLTAPLPQSLKLIEESGLPLRSFDQDELGKIQYLPCLALAVVLRRPLAETVPAIIKKPSAQIDGIFDQKKKGLLTDSSVLVVHASGALSLELWELSETEIIKRLLKETTDVLAKFSASFEPESTILHRWKYCEPQQVHPKKFYSVSLKAQMAPALILAGDSFGASSVDGAFSSGQAAAEFLASIL